MNEERKMLHYDALVVGGGIAGGEAALNLANTGYKVLLVEKDRSLGGKMILLSKVFPTLDCSACITTPKVSEIARHKNITIFTESEVTAIVKKSENDFTAQVTKKPRYVRVEDCTACQLCEKACPVSVRDEYQSGLIGRKAAFIPFSIANPKAAAIDIENCTLCGACEKVCPTHCIDFTMETEYYELHVRTVVLATGFNLFDPLQIPRYGYGQHKNVITSMQMEREIAPTRPYNTILRPGDGKVPDRIAYVLCTGSRDATVGNPICSQICCMYSIKQAQLLMGALPMADVTIYYINIRSFGKGFEEFYQQAKGMGVNFVKGKIGKITEKENGNLILRYEDINEGVVKEAEHDMVVLSVGVKSNPTVGKMFGRGELKLDPFHFVAQDDLLGSPSKTSIDGVFVAGTASAPMDIPDSILSAGSASSEAISYLIQHQEP
ncbi:MAG: CoB--CoM heterodisulfide reductase iron-sulfur subunit A family protein [Petrimonas sp.]|jgi:heterodisulfide reductase subunit A|uniref:CoB--CoM heterodisulfide reductase iron-sulfur subunit A family protein n=1 Tax=Petrimonas TaxID=307628 RepID=UPI000E960C9B|nr:CoB--CoM heterodisulfide reductase iron-sulfur subunit A family protein [Petrimonas sp.]HBF95147.1 4Fe-4S ferredoxin [Porphyromonadaceae bacterium]MDD3543188.1 CoB--CoM heterodisulfide reductase iron-sulfur subunit A family protein [Petrimonas sp.]MDD4016263.1 CoB--CoM heterodisulfide reductase iron-sulfur subunit A family protein [Petrimonas sp.]MDD4537093.1 CoB--CoM heterodisulfide reductase iron-sulfur subunit A family protein [Petrimonas sp.]